MDRRLLNGVGVFLLSGAIFLWVARNVDTPTEPESLTTDEFTLTENSTTLNTDEDIVTPVTQAEPQSSTTESEMARLPATTNLQNHIATFPKNVAEQYRQDLEENIHGTPKIVIQSVAKLHKIYEAIESENDASTAFQFFSGCTTDQKQNVVAIQTSCYRYAKLLAKKFPALEPNFQSLEQNTNNDVLRVVRLNQ